MNWRPLHYQCSALTRLSYGSIRIVARYWIGLLKLKVKNLINLKEMETTAVSQLSLVRTPLTCSKKEVFQPHLPIRLPCYDLAPVTSFTLGGSLRLPTLGTPSFHGLTGGVCKVRERIHRIIADIRLLAIPASWSRVADSNLN